MSSESLGDNMTKYSEAQKRAVAKYNAKTYDEIKTRVPKGAKSIISDYAVSQGKSTNGLVNELLKAEIPALRDIKKQPPKFANL